MAVCGAWRWAQVHPRERCERVPWCRSGILELGCVNGGDLGGFSGDPATVAVVVRCNSGCTIAREEVVVLTQRELRSLFVPKPTLYSIRFVVPSASIACASGARVMVVSGA